jgi:hypothetical protein
MSNKKRRNDKKPITTIKDMVRCPMCRALSYPRVYRNPNNEEEKRALVCGSCHINMTPYFEAMEEFLKVKQAQKEKKEQENNERG